MAPQLPPLDLHAHISPKTRPDELERLGAVVFAATRSLDEYKNVRVHRDQATIWGVGCHPGVAQAQQGFDAEKFALLLASTSFVSEVGLDRRSKVPLDEQELVFDSILGVLQSTPRITSIHSSGASAQVLDALERTPIRGAVLHWWRGDKTQTQRAVELGCWFSVNAAGMKYPNEIALIPLDRILTETDHPYGDRASATPRQPGSVEDVEQALATVHGIDLRAVRGQVWTNLVGIIGDTSVHDLFPPAIQRMVAYATQRGVKD